MEMEGEETMRLRLLAMVSSLLGILAVTCVIEPVALTDMGDAIRYRHQPGGLYPGGSNTIPNGHAAEAPPITGRFGFMSLGMSNTEEHWRAFEIRAGQANPNMVLIPGAQRGRPASRWASPMDDTYDVADARIRSAGLRPSDLQVIWMLQANPHPALQLPDLEADAYVALRHYGDILRAAKQRYPNLRRLYVSTRMGSCAETGLNPEPYAYEYGFAAKRLIEAQIRQRTSGEIDPLVGDVRYWGETPPAPWLAWAAYLWAPVGAPRADGLVYTRADFERDCTHPSREGSIKVSDQLLDFFDGTDFFR
jgi:hypothetical protein